MHHRYFITLTILESSIEIKSVQKDVLEGNTYRGVPATISEVLAAFHAVVKIPGDLTSGLARPGSSDIILRFDD